MYPILDTRVECKENKKTQVNLRVLIRIEPDWNVKFN